tara:strand:- start:579 stop:800 length:222 start_codon:yes stop_codon:yes gene_type:complete
VTKSNKTDQELAKRIKDNAETIEANKDTISSVLKATKKDLFDSLGQQKSAQQVEITQFITRYYQEWLDVRFVA